MKFDVDMYRKIQKESRRTCYHWPTVEEEDLTHRSWEKIVNNIPETDKEQWRLAKIAVRQTVPEFSDDYETFNQDDTYTVAEIRELLDAGILTEQQSSLPGEELSPGVGSRPTNHLGIYGSKLAAGETFFFLDISEFLELFRGFCKSKPEQARMLWEYYGEQSRYSDGNVRYSLKNFTQYINRRMATNRQKARDDEALRV